MEATIVNFRQARHHTYSNHMILIVDGFDTRDKAKDLVGKKVVWTSPAGKEIKGEVRSEHGNKGAVRCIMDTGMPGQSVGTKVKLE